MIVRTIVQSISSHSAPVLVLLPGTYSEPEDFVREGFPAALQKQGIEAELVMAQIRASWFSDGTVVDRIREGVIVPAHERGRSRIWLVGISLGGLAALSYVAHHERDIQGILLISPYPASRRVLSEMQDLCPKRWSKPASLLERDLEREAWMWLVNNRNDKRLPVYCYFASGDRFAFGQRQMARALDSERVRELPGGHDWRTWRVLWTEFLCNSKSALQ